MRRLKGGRRRAQEERMQEVARLPVAIENNLIIENNFKNSALCTSGATKTITVDTNSDEVDKHDNLTSFREAIIKTQQEPGCWNIVFSKKESASYPSDRDDHGLGYWAIKLKDSLPAIKSGAVSINYSDPKTITLIPKNFTQSGNKTKYQLKNNSGTNGSGSLMNIGDMNIKLFQPGHTFDTVGDLVNHSYPTVAINGFNFVGGNFWRRI